MIRELFWVRFCTFTLRYSDLKLSSTTCLDPISSLWPLAFYHISPQNHPLQSTIQANLVNPKSRGKMIHCIPKLNDVLFAIFHHHHFFFFYFLLLLLFDIVLIFIFLVLIIPHCQYICYFSFIFSFLVLHRT